MPGITIKIARRPVYIDFVGDYKPGDLPPSGYCDWHAWASVQHKAGLRQRRCGTCGLYLYPQEVEGHVCKEASR